MQEKQQLLVDDQRWRRACRLDATFTAIPALAGYFQTIVAEDRLEWTGNILWVRCVCEARTILELCKPVECSGCGDRVFLQLSKDVRVANGTYVEPGAPA